MNRILIGHLNINSLRNKFKILVFLIAVNLYILIISETKLDEFCPVSRFLMPGFENFIRLDRSSSGGGIILCIREGVHFKLLKSDCLSASTEAFFVEAKINTKKWLLYFSYNPHKTLIEKHMKELGKARDIYLHNMIIFSLLVTLIQKLVKNQCMISVISII